MLIKPGEWSSQAEACHQEERQTLGHFCDVWRVASVMLLIIISASDANGDFTFQSIADSTGSFRNLAFVGSGPALNNHGQAAFFARLDDGSQGIFVGDGSGVPTPIALTSDIQFDGFQIGVSINDSGLVAFSAILPGPESGIFTGDGTTITKISDSAGSLNNLGTRPHVNNAGVVTFTATIDDTLEGGIFTSDGTNLSPIIGSSGTFSSFTDPVINDSGNVVFQGLLDTGQSGIHRGNGMNISTVADESGPYSFLSGLPSVNQSGSVAFRATLDDSTRGVFLSEPGSVNDVLVADDQGGFSSFPLGLAVNDLGEVVFSATLDTGESGIFVGADPVSDKVIAEGDELFGQAVMDIEFLRGFNNAGQVAFAYTLSDGTSGIAVATPFDPIPEPTTMGLITMGLAAIWLRPARRQA